MRAIRATPCITSITRPRSALPASPDEGDIGSGPAGSACHCRCGASSAAASALALLLLPMPMSPLVAAAMTGQGMEAVLDAVMAELFPPDTKAEAREGGWSPL